MRRLSPGRLPLLVLLAATVPFCAAAACSVAPGFEPYSPDGSLAGEAPAIPDVRIGTITRGQDGTRPGSCADLASITFIVEATGEGGGTAYELQLSRGSLPQPVLPDGPVLAIEQDNGTHTITVTWFEYPVNPERSEALDALIDVRAVSPTGRRSEPVTLHLRHPGGVRS